MDYPVAGTQGLGPFRPQSWGNRTDSSTPDVCPSCGTTRRDLDVDGRMGCADCYDVFEAEVVQALREIHGAVQHIGKA